MEGFKLTHGGGFHIGFKNGITVSVQFGQFNYCENKEKKESELPRGNFSCENAEIGILDVNEDLITTEYTGKEDDVVLGWQKPEDLLKILKWASEYKPKVK